MGKITKPQAEKALRLLVHQWANEVGVKIRQKEMPQFYDFVGCLRRHGYGDHLELRSVMGPLEDVESWFDEELKQLWRN